jgi:hypothetical protein
LNVYTHTGFHGHWPVGTSAVVVAENEFEAARLLEEALIKHSLPQRIDPTDFSFVLTDKPAAHVLTDGDY